MPMETQDDKPTTLLTDAALRGGYPRRFRTLWISDVHLGTRGCQAEYLLDFLRHHETETLYLVGDIVDAWALKGTWYWPQSHNDVVQKILRKARAGTRVLYIPGNHDEVFRDFVPLVFGGVQLLSRAIHETADGRRLLVMHGDELDGLLNYASWISKLGSHAYDAALWINRWFNLLRRRMGYPYWALSSYMKHKVKNAMAFITKFEETLAREARHQGVDGVICGHIHWAETRRMGDILYCNTGDWVEHCTALAEYENGQLEIITWSKNLGSLKPEMPPQEARLLARAV